jgi:CubicO group peptidase (beta-lactamase class C family)
MTGAFTSDGLHGLHEAALRYVGDDMVPGLVMLVASGGEVHAESLGRLMIGGPLASRGSLFRISSTTKPITGALTMALVDDGLLSLDEPVDRLLPELADRRVLRGLDGPLDDTVPAERPITVRDLLTFTFGFGLVTEIFTEPTLPVVAKADELRLATLGPPDPAMQPDPDTWIAGLGSLPLMAQPGERWMYNTGASVLGVLAARAAGETLPELLRARIFDPLGMTDTAFWTSEPGRLAAAYRAVPEGLQLLDPPDGDWSRPPAFADGAAGLLSTVDDLYTFASMLLRGGAPVLSRESVQAMTTDQLTAAQKARGGLGPDFFSDRSWSLCQAVYDDGTYGWDGGLGTSWLVDPRRDLVVIVLTQRMDGPALPPLHRDVRAAAYRALA